MERATVIVALPPVGDKVHKISSEAVAHMTMLYLGDVDLSEDAMLYVQHACEELSPFGCSVDYRGTLGEDDADVLFFENDRWDMKRVSQFRHWLLLNDEIKLAYEKANQFPEWTPHLTLGYPESPAREIEGDDYLGYISFDRIAVWTGNFEGPEFRLKYDDYGMDDVAMSDMSAAERGAAAVAELFHYGKKGMKWGVRKDRETSKGGASQGPTSVVVTQKKPGKFAKATGGQGHPLHEDAKVALEARQKAKASTTDALSNAELRKAVERMNLEKQYSQLQFESDRRGKGMRFAAGLFGAKRYSGEKRRYKDTYEDLGESTKKTADAVATVLKERKAS